MSGTTMRPDPPDPRDRHSVGHSRWVTRQVIERVTSDTLCGTGAISSKAAEVFTSAILAADETKMVKRKASGRIASDFTTDYQSVFELYRQRYRLLGLINDWTQSTDGRYRQLYFFLRECIHSKDFKGALPAMEKAANLQEVYAVATSLYADLASEALGEAGAAFLRSLYTLLSAK